MPPIAYILILPGVGAIVLGLIMNAISLQAAKRAAERAKSEPMDENMKKAMENMYFIQKMQYPGNNMRVIAAGIVVLALCVGIGFFEGLFTIK